MDSNNPWQVILILQCNVYSLCLTKALLVQASTEPVCLIRLRRNMQYYKFKQRYLKMIIILWCHQSGSSMIWILLHVAIILSADTSLNSKTLFVPLSMNHSKCHACLCVSPTCSNMQTLHSINSNTNKLCLFYLITAVTVLVLCVSPLYQVHMHSSIAITNIGWLSMDHSRCRDGCVMCLSKQQYAYSPHNQQHYNKYSCAII